MLTLHTNENYSPVATEEEQGYNVGFVVGTFDKCNGREARDFRNVEVTDYNAGYVDGYLDGYCSNEVNNGEGS